MALARSSLGSRSAAHAPSLSHILLGAGLSMSMSAAWHSGHSDSGASKQASAFWLFEAPLCPHCPPRFFTATVRSPFPASASASAPPSRASATTALYFARALFLSDLDRDGVFSLS